MKFSEIKVGETYAVRTSRYGNTYQVRVLHTCLVRPGDALSTSPSPTRGHKGFLVEIFGSVSKHRGTFELHPAGNRRRCAARYFVSTWDEYERARAEADAAEVARREKNERAQRAWADVRARVDREVTQSLRVYGEESARLAINLDPSEAGAVLNLLDDMRS